MQNSKSESYAAAGVDITAGYKAVELMKAHIARTRNEGCLDDVGGFGGCGDRAADGRLLYFKGKLRSFEVIHLPGYAR